MLNQADVNTCFKQTTSKDHEIELTKEAIELGYETIVIVGGSGTLHNVLQQIVGTSINICIFPTGVSNGFARHIGIQPNNKALIDAILANNTRTADVGKVTTEDKKVIYFTSYFTLGLSGLFVKKIQNIKGIHNRFQYVIQCIKAFHYLEVNTIQLIFNSFNETFLFKELYIGNIASYGGQLSKLGYTSIQNGEFRIQVWREIRLRRFLEFITKYFFKIDDNFSDTFETYSSSEVELYFTEPTYVNLDLELYELKGHILVENQHKAINLIVPLNCNI